MTTVETKRPRQVRGAAMWRWAWLLAVLVWPVFAHGCHTGDHDDELMIAPPPDAAAQADERN
jgi:hypothetical protein